MTSAIHVRPDPCNPERSRVALRIMTEPTDSRRSTSLDTRISAGQSLVELVRVGVEKGLSPSPGGVESTVRATRERDPRAQRTSTAAMTRGRFRFAASQLDLTSSRT